MMLTSAPLSAAPHDVFSSALHSGGEASSGQSVIGDKASARVSYHVPNAAAERRKAQLPQWSPGAMATAAAAAGGRRAWRRRGEDEAHLSWPW